MFSPGGNLQCPSKRRSLDCGEGPTPMLTRALKRKFRVNIYLDELHANK